MIPGNKFLFISRWLALTLLVNNAKLEVKRPFFTALEMQASVSVDPTELCGMCVNMQMLSSGIAIFNFTPQYTFFQLIADKFSMKTECKSVYFIKNLIITNHMPCTRL